MGDVAREPTAWADWLAVCGLKREATIWGGRAVAGGGRCDLLAERLEAAIAAERPAGLISFGVCGALSPDLAVGEALVGTSVTAAGGASIACDPAVAEGLARSTGARIVRVVGSETVVADQAAKASLARFGEAVDMESHIAARIAARHGLPLAVLRVVSDEARHSLPPAAVAGMAPDGGVNVVAVLSALARDPGQLPTLMRLGRDSGRAFETLRAARRALR